jgi:hypothetical protein
MNLTNVVVAQTITTHVDIDDVATTVVKVFSGDQGDIGPTGATGATGPQGPANGPTGPTGATGSIGPSGPAGPTGQRGATGNQGPTGPTGPTGPSGSTGLQGSQGIKGDLGPTGPIGPTGPSGGPVGPTGATGGAGLNFAGDWDEESTYNFPDTVFYEGSSWIAQTSVEAGEAPNLSSGYWSLVSSKGASGPTGPAGPTGPPGDSAIGPIDFQYRGATGSGANYVYNLTTEDLNKCVYLNTPEDSLPVYVYAPFGLGETGDRIEIFYNPGASPQAFLRPSYSPSQEAPETVSFFIWGGDTTLPTALTIRGFVTLTKIIDNSEGPSLDLDGWFASGDLRI